MSKATILSEKKKILVPQLRFVRFEDEWEEKIMRDICKINQGLQIPISERFYEKADDNFFYVTNEFLRKDSTKSYFIKNPSESVICYKDDILMTRTGNTGQVVTNVHGAFHNNFFKIKYDNTCDKWFLYYFLTSYKTQGTILKLAGTSTIPDLNHGDFYKIAINIPTLPEQQKIASFLSVVDEKIQQLSRKKELLEQYKKGVMQQLFSGKLRFKDENGEDYPDWEMKKLKEFTKPVKRTTDRIIDNIMTISGANGFMDQKDRFSQVIAAGSLGKYTHLLKNEFAYNRGNSKSYKYGCIYKLNHEEALIPYVYHSFKLDFGVPEFFEQIFKAKYLDAQLRGLISSSARMDGLLNIGANNFFQVKVVFPYIEEQQKIANFLSSIDSKIESVNQQLVQTQSFKKGLLQRMFV